MGEGEGEGLEVAGEGWRGSVGRGEAGLTLHAARHRVPQVLLRLLPAVVANVRVGACNRSKVTGSKMAAARRAQTRGCFTWNESNIKTVEVSA